MIAVYRGLIDPFTARPYDHRWQQHVALVLQELRRQLSLEDLQARLCHNQATFGFVRADQQKAVWYRMQDNLLDYRKGLRPWEKFKDDRENRLSEMRKLENAWASEYGDPNDPETQASIARTVAYLNRKG